MTDQQSIPIEFHTELSLDRQALLAEAEAEIQQWAQGHSDITGASITVERAAHGETPHLFEVNIALYVRPEHLAATEKSDSAEGALQGALNALERQLRSKREKLGEPWKRPDIDPGPA